MVGVMAVSSHPATTTAGVVGGSCDVASGERDRERLTASGGQSRASMFRAWARAESGVALQTGDAVGV